METLLVAVIDGDICKVDVSSQCVETRSLGVIDGDVHKVGASSPSMERLSAAVIDDDVHEVDVSNQGAETLSVAVLMAFLIRKKLQHEKMSLRILASMKLTGNALLLQMAVLDGVVNKEEVKALKDEATNSMMENSDRKCISFGECSFVGDVHKVDVSIQGVETLSIALMDGVANQEEAMAQKNEAEDFIKDSVDRKSVCFWRIYLC
ncbi:hypothetical protein O6H91_12G061000 [Diphasiastrum complanatum]|uniref:Uncharacterized protein n=1 Tax=Diphasiastrum complanatum TaxID=34168 RepID=A0ACC2C2K3_DIPCM|nr:hypothetical protein O6H91_12G061000 [Diphasiastrum complanatum]